jgi:farnesyl-diphosphate farnesyltransferase
LAQTHTQLAAGMRYAMALKPLRLRLASALPALIGAQTLALLRQKGPGAITEHTKVSRRDLRGLFWQLALGWGSPATLGQLFVKLSGRTVA